LTDDSAWYAEMEGPSPKPLDYAAPPIGRPTRPFALVAISATTILFGAAFGATTNAINGVVSPTYFIRVMGWSTSNVWAESVAEGVFEGLVIGTMLSVIFTLTTGLVTQATVEYLTLLRCLLRIAVAVFCLWAIGGVAGVVLAYAFPGFFGNTFIGVPDSASEMLRYAWVGGSIWGEYMGGPLGMTVALVLFSVRWKRGKISDISVGQPRLP
jgi:hypothetical protein